MPSGPETEFNRALAAINKRQYAEAAAILDVATSQYPEADPLWDAWIKVLRELRLDEEALAAVRRFVEARPESGYAWLLLGQDLNHFELYEEAASALRNAVRLLTDPTHLHFAAFEMVGSGCAEEAFAIEERLVREHSDYAPAYLNASYTHEQAGDSEGAWRYVEGAYNVAPDNPDVLRTRAALSNYRDDLTPKQHFAMVKEYGELLESSIQPYLGGFLNNRNADRKLRVGFLSPDFREHAVAEFTLEAIEALDSGEFDVSLYYIETRIDEVTDRFSAAASRFREMANVAPRAVMDQIRADKIDILVDLVGHTSGGIVGAMAMRPAPVQITHIGYPGSTGLHRMQFRVVDSFTDPSGSEALSTETLHRLDPCFLCYRPIRGFPEIAPVDFNRPLTFGCFGNLMKIAPTTARLWASALRAVPDSKLVLNTRSLRSESTRTMISRLLESNGVPLDRVEMRPGAKLAKDFASAYREIDVALDTYPYHGTTTTCEASSWGVPTVTLAGDRHLCRVGVSLLSNLGHPDWVAQSEDEFASIAARLIQDRNQLALLRTELPKQLQNSPICNLEAYAERLSEFYRSAWRDWCENPV